MKNVALLMHDVALLALVVALLVALTKLTNSTKQMQAQVCFSGARASSIAHNQGRAVQLVSHHA
jgi:hypothetical protein